MPSRSRLVAVVVLALLVLTAACGGKPKSPRSAGSSTPTTSATDSGGGAATTSGAATGTTATTTGGTSTTTGGTSTTGVPPGTPPFSPRPPGTYYYSTNGTTKVGNNSRPMPARTSLVVDPASGNAQRSLRDLRDSEGRGRTTETIVRSDADGIHLTYLKTTTSLGSGFTDERTFQPNPPPLILRTGAPNGDHLEFTIQGDHVTARTTVDVIRRETITIGGTALQAIVIRIHTDFSGQVSGSDDATNWIRPADGLLLKETDDSSAQSSVVRVEAHYTATLEKLTPS